MTKIELVYDDDCPNVEAAREQLRKALRQAGRPDATWTEWHAGDPALPDHARGYGSPTILIGGRDVTGAAAGDGCSCCRVYQGDDGGLAGVPTVEAIVAAL